jgi:hypothetical protein
VVGEQVDRVVPEICVEVDKDKHALDVRHAERAWHPAPALARQPALSEHAVSVDRPADRVEEKEGTVGRGGGRVGNGRSEFEESGALVVCVCRRREAGEAPAAGVLDTVSPVPLEQYTCQSAGTPVSCTGNLIGLATAGPNRAFLAILRLVCRLGSISMAQPPRAYCQVNPLGIGPNGFGRIRSREK